LVFDLDLQDVAWFGVDKADQTSKDGNDRHVRAVFASCAVLVEILREVMGFEQFLAVYSGRRGVHLWVLDERAFGWGDGERDALCKFIAGTPSKSDSRVIETRHIRKNPSFGENTWKAVEMARNVLIAPRNDGGVGFFDRQRNVDRFLTLFFDVKIEDEFKNARERKEREVRILTNTKTGWDAYYAIKTAVSSNKFYANRFCDVMLSLTWPIVDVGATAKANHCTKCIFSLHAKTGRVAVPIPLERLCSTKANPLPPIVYPHEINVSGTSSMRHFHDGLELTHQAVRVVAPRNKIRQSTTTQDIEDLVSDVAKRPRL